MTPIQARRRRRHTTGLALAAGVFALLVTGCPNPEPAAQTAEQPSVITARPNVLLLSIDTLRADHLGTYGYERETAPKLDALARLGVVFERATSHSPKTAPSHMSLMTSLYPEAHGVRQLSHSESRRLADDIPTLPEILQAAGYRTAAITAGGNVSAELGFDRGIHSYQVIHDVETLMQSAAVQMQAMQGVAAEREPLFVFLHTYEVHDPYMPKPPYRDLFSDPGYAGQIPASAGSVDAQGRELFEKTHDYFWERVDRDDPRDTQHLRDLYDGSIRRVDDEFAKLIAWMRRTELFAETLVVVLSDHGEEFLDHGEFLHSRVYQEHLHVPLIVIFPAPDRARFAGLRIAQPVRLIDVAPTLLDYLDLPIPENMQGESLMPLIERRRDASERPVMSSYSRRGYLALRDGRWKLIVRHTARLDGSGFVAHSELYDLDADPHEQHDVAAQHAERVSEMRSRLDELDAQAKARYQDSKPGDPTRPDEQTVEGLRALGYVE